MAKKITKTVKYAHGFLPQSLWLTVDSRTYMASLSHALLLPPKIKNVVRPANPLNRFNKIGAFVLWNLSQTLLSDPHYEASVYGAFNGYLGAIFGLDRHFLIKPQGMIRPVVHYPRMEVSPPPTASQNEGDSGVAGGGNMQAAGGPDPPAAASSIAQFPPQVPVSDGIGKRERNTTGSHGERGDLDLDLNDDDDNGDLAMADNSFGSYMGEHNPRGQGE